MRKRILALLLMAALLCGCGAQTEAPETTAQTSLEEFSMVQDKVAEVLEENDAEAVLQPMSGEDLAESLGFDTVTMDVSGDDRDVLAASEEPVSIPLGPDRPRLGDTMSAQDEVNQKAEASQASPQRPSYDLGNCRSLRGDVFAITIFLDDAESSWNDEDIWQFWNGAQIPGYNYLAEEATQRGIPLEIESSCYYTGMRDGLSVRYDGTATDADNSTFQSGMEMLDQALLGMGFTSREHFRERMVEFSGCEDVVVIVALNKPGRSFSWCNSMEFPNFFEFCIVFSSYQDSDMDTCPCTIVHETLHLFGAEDYYDPYGDLPNRKQMAAGMFPHDIMYNPYTDVTYNEIGSFTEFSIGWRDALPAECNTELWWS